MPIIDSDKPTNPPTVKTIIIDAESAGQRLDNFLIKHLKGVPKTHVYRIIRSGEVRINKGRVEAQTRLNTGDVVRVPPVRLSGGKELGVNPGQARQHNPSIQAFPAKEFPLLLEDEWMLAINKPSGVAVHGGSGVSFGVIEQLRMARPTARLLELVHRLDKETSGILLVAKKRSALTQLQAQFKGRETGKTYLAMVKGQWPTNKKVIDLPLLKYTVVADSAQNKNSDHASGERRVKVLQPNDPSGLRAITLVKLSRLVGSYSLLEVTIKTGRTHQIRVHLASQGYPIIGDEKYGDFEHNRELKKMGLKRMFLHAWRLRFNHPQSEKSILLEAPLPSELKDFIDYVQPRQSTHP
jgi:23S rRNA pseudouridine955/2504/2580 synthase